jgi:hypothetical protein
MTRKSLAIWQAALRPNALGLCKQRRVCNNAPRLIAEQARRPQHTSRSFPRLDRLGAEYWRRQSTMKTKDKAPETLRKINL